MGWVTRTVRRMAAWQPGLLGWLFGEQLCARKLVQDERNRNAECE